MLYRLPVTPMTNPDLHCLNCGHHSGEGDRYCTECGADLVSGYRDPVSDALADDVPWNVFHITGALFLFLALLFLAAFSARAIGDLYPVQEAALETWVAVHLIAFCAVLTVWLMGLRHAGSPMRAIGLVNPQTTLPVTALWAVGALGFSILSTFAYGLVVDQLGLEVLQPPEIQPEIIFSGAGILLTLQALTVLTPLSEEMLFRGFVLRGLLRNIAPGPAVVATAVVFSALHLDPGTVIPIFFTGLALGWVYVKTRSLWPCIAAHAGQNLLALLVVAAGL